MTETYFEEESFQTEFNGRTLWRILAQTRPHWRLLVGFLLGVIVVAVVESYFTFLLKQIVDRAILQGDRPFLYRSLAVYGALTLVLAAGVFAFIYMAANLGERVRYDLRKRMFEHLQTLSFSYFDRTPIGWIMSRVTSDSERLADLVTWGLLDVTWGITNIIAAAAFMLWINWRLALIVLLIIPILVIVSAEFKRRILQEYRQVRRMNSRITGAYNENITGVRVTKALAQEQRDLEDFQALSSDMFRASYRAAWLSALFLPMIQLISATAVAAVAYFGGLQALDGRLSAGDLQAFVGYITFMLWPVQEMARVYAQMQQAIASAERIFSLVDARPEIVDRPGAVDPGSLRGPIDFVDVSFYYEPDKPVLENFSLSVRPGETIALVGPTGGGKSTIVNLLCRFYEPTAGCIRFDSRDYTALTQAAIHSRLGMVLQTPHLFSGTVRENIRYGRLDATDDEVEAAARLAGADAFIAALENGYEEEVGEGGVLLSVGQKQLISLARAILAEPDIFIMDEATSSVDTLTEALIQQGMEVLLAERTSFIIAHRLSTIRRADRILVIEDGRIAEMGSHAELIRLGGHYYRLYTQQFRRERAAHTGPVTA